MSKVRIIGAADESVVGSKGGMTGGKDITEVGEVETAVLQKNLSQLVTQLSGVLEDLEQQKSYKLKQFSVGVEVSAKGGVSLIGKLEAGAKAGLTLVFEKD